MTARIEQKIRRKQIIVAWYLIAKNKNIKDVMARAQRVGAKAKLGRAAYFPCSLNARGKAYLADLKDKFESGKIKMRTNFPI